MSSTLPSPPCPDSSPRADTLNGSQGPPLQGVIDAAKVLIWSADSLGRFDWVCGCWPAMTGQSAQAALGFGWREAIHPDDRGLLRTSWRSRDPSSHAFECLVRVKTIDGDYRWRLLRANRVAEPTDQVGRWLGVFLDVDAVADAHVASQSRAQSVLDTVSEGIVTISERGVIESFNPAATTIFGYAKEEVIGQNVSILMPAPWALEHDGYLQRYLRTGVRKVIGVGREVVGRRKNGSTFPLDLSVSEVRLRNGRFYTGILRDLTELRAAQSALIRAERLAGIGQMVAAIGHESRNAVQRIQASVELLKLQLVDHAQALKDLETIERADAELRSLFSDLRSWITPIKLGRSRIDLQNVWNRAWEHLLSVRGSCDARLDARIGDVDTSMEADASLLEQVFRNLFENSLQAATGPVRVVIEAVDSTIGRMPALRLRIRDNGMGIAEQDLDRCFEPFYTTKRRGLGLGLAIVKQLVEAHHGAIKLRSLAPASGVEVELTLPRGLPERLDDERLTGIPKATRRVAAKALPR